MQILRPLCGLWLIVMTGLVNARDISPVDRLTYEVQEGDREPGITRVWVSSQMMREDEGEDGDGYLLFDRRDKVIYSINLEERTVLVIPPAEPSNTQTRPPDLNLRQLPGESAPRVAGREPQHWQLRLGHQVCEDGWVVPGLMPESIAAMREYRETLARQQRLTLDRIPEAYRDPCDDAVQVYVPAALLQKGLPLHSRDAKGVVWRLIDFTHVETPPEALFERPEGFETMTMPGQVMSEPAPEIPDVHLVR
jgi:hypothetical protein